jgi:hypothetical protein
MNKKSLDILAQLFNSNIVTSNRDISKAFHITDLHLVVQSCKEKFPEWSLAKLHFVASIRHLLTSSLRLQSLGSLSLSLIRCTEEAETAEFPHPYSK